MFKMHEKLFNFNDFFFHLVLKYEIIIEIIINYD